MGKHGGLVELSERPQQLGSDPNHLVGSDEVRDDEDAMDHVLQCGRGRLTDVPETR